MRLSSTAQPPLRAVPPLVSRRGEDPIMILLLDTDRQAIRRRIGGWADLEALIAAAPARRTPAGPVAR